MEKRARGQRRAEVYALNAALGRADRAVAGRMVLVLGGSNLHRQVESTLLYSLSYKPSYNSQFK